MKFASRTYTLTLHNLPFKKIILETVHIRTHSVTKQK